VEEARGDAEEPASTGGYCRDAEQQLTRGKERIKEGRAFGGMVSLATQKNPREGFIVRGEDSGEDQRSRGTCSEGGNESGWTRVEDVEGEPERSGTGANPLRILAVASEAVPHGTQ